MGVALKVNDPVVSKWLTDNLASQDYTHTVSNHDETYLNMRRDTLSFEVV